MRGWDTRGRYWNNPEVHFWWESPVAAGFLLAAMAWVGLFI